MDRSQDNSTSWKSLLCEFLALFILVKVCSIEHVLLKFGLLDSGEDPPDRPICNM